MKEYRCSWQIDVTAETPRAAAEQAERLMAARRQSSWRVTDGESCAVDVEVRPVHEPLALIGAKAREFLRRCEADEHMDTGEASDLLDWIAEHATDAPPAPRYRFILEIFSSRFDRNGNRYHYANLLSTVTGKSVQFQAHAQSNARLAVWDALAPRGALSDRCYTREIQDVPMREHARVRNKLALGESDITPELLEELEAQE